MFRVDLSRADRPPCPGSGRRLKQKERGAGKLLPYKVMSWPWRACSSATTASTPCPSGSCGSATPTGQDAPDDGRVVSNFIVQALRGQDITLFGDGYQTRSFCFVDDLIRGMVGMMEQTGTSGP